MTFPMERPDNAGLSALYTLQDIFLNKILQRYTIGQLIEDNNITKFEDFGEKLPNNWQSWIVHYVGLVIAVLAGFLLVVVLPVRGFCFCCCTKKDSKNPPKPSVCKTGSCCLVLVAFLLVMMSMACLLFILTALVDNELKGGGITTDVKAAISKVDQYLKGTVSDLDSKLTATFDEFQVDVNTYFNTFGAGLVREVEEDIGIYPALYTFSNYTENDLPALEKNLTEMENMRSQLVKDYDDLGIPERLNDSFANVQLLLQDCVDMGTDAEKKSCNAAIVMLMNTSHTARFASLDALTVPIMVLDQALDGRLGKVGEFVEAMDEVTDEIQVKVDDLSKDLNSTLDELEVDLSDATAEISDYLDEFDLTQYNDNVDQVQTDYVEAYAQYAAIAYFALAAFALVVPVVVLMGLVTCFCANEHGGKGEKVLKCGLLIFFIFGWLMALVTALSLLAGGMTEIFLCRHAVEYDSSMQALEKVGRASFSLPQELDDVLISNLLYSCGKNESLYQALDLSGKEIGGYNLSNIVNIDEWSNMLQDEIDNIQLPDANVTIMNDEVITLAGAVDSQLSSIDFDSFHFELSNAARPGEVSKLIAEVENTVKLLDNSADVALQTIAGKLTDEMQVLNETVVVLEEVEPLYETLETATTQSVTIVNSQNLTELVSVIEGAQNEWNTNGEQALKDQISQASHDLVGIVNTTAESITTYLEEDFGRCSPVTESYNLTINSVCVHFLNPFNAYWFASGWYITFTIIGIAFITSMALMLKGLNVNTNRITPAESEAPVHNKEAPPPPPYTPTTPSRRNKVHPAESLQF